jgi:hypothetical protein
MAAGARAVVAGREQEAGREIAAGRGTVHESADSMFTHLDGLGAADA